MRKLAPSILLAISIGAATTASSQSPQSAAPTLDPAWKMPEVIAFIGLRKGDKVADIIRGRLTASLAQAVGPSGKVYAIETAEFVKGHPAVLKKMMALATQSQKSAVMLLEMRQLRTLRLNQSIIATRYTKPRAIGI